MQHVRFGLGIRELLTGDDGHYSDAAEVGKFLDDAGFAVGYCSDDQTLRADMYVACAVAAMHTKRIRILAGPTNPLTRHPAVTAGGTASLDLLSHERMMLNLSIGFSNVRNAGYRPAKMATLRDYTVAVKELFSKKETVFKGRKTFLKLPSRAIPVILTAEGPKTLRLAGEVADGVIIGFGLTPEAIKAALGYLKEGAESAGRTLKDIDIWWQVRWSVADDRATALEMLRGRLSSAATHVFSYGFEDRFVPPQFHDEIRALGKRYLATEHETGGGRERAFVDSPALKEYLASRFAAYGTPKQLVERLEELAALGVTQLRLAPGSQGESRDKQLEVLAKQVMPHFKLA